MTNYPTKTVMLTLFTLWLGAFAGSPGYAITLKDETQKLLASDGVTKDYFGRSVFIDRDTAVIGARGDNDNGFGSGSVYVFVRDETGVWHEQQKLTASDGVAADSFGYALSVSGNTIMIGALGNDSNGRSSGSVYVFVRDGTNVWSEQQKIIASDGAAGDVFGISVSIAGDIAVIGATGDNDNGDGSGSVYVFIRDGAGSWNEQQKLSAEDGAAGDSFGWSVSNFDDMAVIGATGDDDNGARSGSAYVFIRNSLGVWSEQQKLNASDAFEDDRFGGSVSISGDSVVIGATQEDDISAGKAYVFVRDGNGVWNEQQKLNASDGMERDRFGSSVSIFGDTTVIGAESDDDNGRDSGSAYIFVRDNSGVWNEKLKLNASDGARVDRFANSVSISGGTALIGAWNDADNGLQSGSAYVFEDTNPLLTVEKRINYRLRQTAGEAAQLLAGTRYLADYKVTNNSPNRIYRVQVFESAKLVCNLYALDPGESMRGCAQNQPVLAGIKNIPATVTANVVGSSETLVGQGNAYYTGHNNVSGELTVTHYVNERNADTQAAAVEVNGNQTAVKFRVKNTSSIEQYRVRLYHDPASPVNSGWQELCFFGSMLPGQVRYCKRIISVANAGLNKAFGRAQGLDANISPAEFINASNPTYFNVTLP